MAKMPPQFIFLSHACESDKFGMTLFPSFACLRTNAHQTICELTAPGITEPGL